MYKVTLPNSIEYLEAVRFITLHSNGCYVLCEEKAADGICIKLPITLTNEETGEPYEAVQDTVFALKEGGLHGTEPLATVKAITDDEYNLMLSLRNAVASGSITPEQYKAITGDVYE